MLLKWSKTLQFNDQIKVITLPRLKSLSICPYAAGIPFICSLWQSASISMSHTPWLSSGYRFQSKENFGIHQFGTAFTKKCLYLPCFPAFRCHLGIQGPCTHKGNYGPGHLDVRLRVEVYPERCRQGFKCCQSYARYAPIMLYYGLGLVVESYQGHSKVMSHNCE